LKLYTSYSLSTGNLDSLLSLGRSYEKRLKKGFEDAVKVAVKEGKIKL